MKSSSLFLQFVTMVPESVVPSLSWCKKKSDDDEEEDDLDPHVADDPVSGGRGQILWVRGLTRLQQQVRHKPTSCVTLCRFAMALGDFCSSHHTHNLKAVLS